MERSAHRDLRSQIRAGTGMLGTFCVVGCTEIVELIAISGFDFVILDMEHGPFDLQQVSRCLLAAHLRGMPVIVRVANSGPSAIGGVLDLGADGILAPHVDSAEAAADVVAAARFAPHGHRGAHPWVRAAGFDGASGSDGTSADWLADANSAVAVLVMVESAEAIRNLESIVRVPGLDGVFLGPMDLSHALGVPGRPEHELVVDAMAGAFGAASRAGLTTAVFAPTPNRARTWLQQGAGLVACGVDSKLLLDGLRSAVRASR
jgi:4-hydroxy-2-oxoheptanedioate aldolase